jgi:outer membrane biosynthesis protein TonB
MDISFRNSVFISIAIHLLIFFPLLNSINENPRNRDRILVDYIILKEAKAAAEKRVAETRPAVTPKVEMKAKAEPRPAPSAAPAKKQAAERVSQEIAKKQARIKSTKDYINYYDLIREKIRQRLKDHYSRQYREGEVRLVFVLRSDGTLTSEEADSAYSTQDASLIDIALKSLKEASPLPPFPKALDLPEMSFDLTVVFKKD